MAVVDLVDSFLELRLRVESNSWIVWLVFGIAWEATVNDGSVSNKIVNDVIFLVSSTVARVVDFTSVNVRVTFTLINWV